MFQEPVPPAAAGERIKARTFVCIGPAPYEEDCAKLGDADYAARTRDELRSFARQIERHYPPRGSARVHGKWFDHDFGRYAEVVVSYDEDDREGEEYALEVEHDPKNVLAKWDDQGIGEMAEWLFRCPQLEVAR